MSITRRAVLCAAASALPAPVVLRAARADAAPVTLRLHHFLPPSSNGHKGFLVPWADRIAKQSQGKLKIEIMPSMQMGGAPEQLFDQVSQGVVDLAWTLPGYTPDRFAAIEAFELPFIAARKAEATSAALHQYAMRNLQKEFRNVVPVAFWAHDHGVLHTRKPVNTMADLKGMKLRAPTRLSGAAFEALGASVVQIPVPQVPVQLVTGEIDGAAMPWEVVPALKMHELTKHHTEIAGSPTLYTSTFVLAMNYGRYNSLPIELKTVIDANSGLNTAIEAGRSWDAASVEARTLALAAGGTIITLAEDEKARWIGATRPVTEQWLATAGQRGLQPMRLMEEVREAIAVHDKG